MGLSKMMKRTGRSRSVINKNKTKHVFRPFDSIHSDMVLEVLARVAASSFDDFVNAKLSCKVFNEVAESDYIFQRISLQRFPVIPWRTTEKTSSFLKRCKDCGNPEALYRQAVVDFFDSMSLKSSIEYLQTAAKMKHVKALYTLGIVFLFCGAEFKQMGMKILMEMNQSKIMRKQVRDCRENLKAILRRMWINNALVLSDKPICCARQHQILVGWDEEEYEIECDACKCDREVSSIYKCFPQVQV